MSLSVGSSLERALTVLPPGSRQVRPVDPVADSGDGREGDEGATFSGRRDGHEERQASASAAYFRNLASAGFMAQLAALYLGDSDSGDRRTRRDPAIVLKRADDAYRAAGRRVSSIEPGFLSSVAY